MESDVKHAPDEPFAPIMHVGAPGVQGGYLLRMRVDNSFWVTFGCFNRGRRTYIDSGVYLYLGSAVGFHGSASLPYRVMRHTLRSGNRTPHKIRKALFKYFIENNLVDDGIEKFVSKRVHWHVDYLLDQVETELTNVLLLCSRSRVERLVYDLICEKDELEIIERGLGASDSRNLTHLWRLNETDLFWRLLIRELEDFFAQGYV